LASSSNPLGPQSYSAPVQVPEHNWLLKVSFNHQNFISKFNVARNQYGIWFSLDNFGTGILTFAQMKNIPIRRINIDGRLINQIIDDPVAKAQVK
jgi:EAL domain-containing protein (putative c-di-GMP-specific phosphodiesterase class I)